MSEDGSAPISLLFVDPDTESRAYWVTGLKIASPGYVITEALDGQSALDLCQARTFDCVVLEAVLPDLSGFEVLMHLCPPTSTAIVPVVMLTKLVLARLSNLAKWNGAQAYLLKGYTSVDELDLTIRRAIKWANPTSRESQQ
ncbi:protein of unknown function [Nitrospira japonica]|uniref:Response regulatory domain-containing protein n=1 Tax=Nitrospira japonica TaxID=1325564 RepID=A0A1W1I481_9BACT|nr:response regulator [Nitrospira japonica]SLM47679.1 protein of unknown function [Nitrospira japonica]